MQLTDKLRTIAVNGKPHQNVRFMFQPTITISVDMNYVIRHDCAGIDDGCLVHGGVCCEGLVSWMSIALSESRRSSSVHSTAAVCRR